MRKKIEEFIKKAISTARYVALPNADKNTAQQMIVELEEEAEKIKEEMDRVLR